MLVVQDGKVVHRKGYGLADVERRVPITPQTAFELASVSKQFTAMAVMLLHDRGKLGFDDDVRKHLPELPQFDRRRPIRIRDLLHHTSGLPDYLEFEKIPARVRGKPTNAEVLSELAKHKLSFPTGTRYEYCNSGYILLAQIVERASGRRFTDFLHEEIFSPLDMTHTVGFDDRRAPRRDRAVAYQAAKESSAIADGDLPETIFRKTRADMMKAADAGYLVVGDGSVFSSLEDLAKWDAAVREGRLAKPETWKQAFTNLRLDNSEEPDEDYGFGWWLEFDKAGRLSCVSHDGSWTGCRTIIARHLDKHLTIVILSNIDEMPVDVLEQRIFRLCTDGR